MRPTAPDAKSFAHAIGTEYKACIKAQRHYETSGIRGLRYAKAAALMYSNFASQWQVVAYCWKRGHFHGAK